jgi:hypothetical protein
VIINIQSFKNEKTLTILNKDRPIFIPINLKYIIKDKFKDNRIQKYESHSKYSTYTSNEIEFEILRDLNEPTNDFLPFIFHNWVA